MRVLLGNCFYRGHESGCHSHIEAKPSLQGGGRHVDKHTIGDGLRSGVAEDDFSEKDLGAVCFGGFKAGTVLSAGR
jgi:hypothetical protein